MEYVTPTGLASEWGVKTDIVLSHIHSGALEAVNVSRGSQRPRWRVSREAVQRFENTRSNRQVSPARKSATQKPRRQHV